MEFTTSLKRLGEAFRDLRIPDDEGFRDCMLHVKADNPELRLTFTDFKNMWKIDLNEQALSNHVSFRGSGNEVSDVLYRLER
jgi:hypothetical protein